MTWPDDYINKIINGDCLEVMKGIPDKAVDFIFADAPYGIGLDYGEGFVDNSEYIETNTKTWVAEMRRITTDDGLMAVTCGITNLCRWPQSNWVLCWHYKSYDSRVPFGFNQWQPVLLYGKDRTVPTGCRPDFIEHLESSNKNGHPCPKPLGFIKKLIRRFAVPENGIILDPFCGSGTTCVAAKELGINYVGIELNPDYCRISEDRLRQQELFV